MPAGEKLKTTQNAICHVPAGFTEILDAAIEAKEGLSGAKEGFFPDTFVLCRNRTFAFVSIDADLYAPRRLCPFSGTGSLPAAR